MGGERKEKKKRGLSVCVAHVPTASIPQRRALLGPAGLPSASRRTRVRKGLINESVAPSVAVKAIAWVFLIWISKTKLIYIAKLTWSDIDKDDVFILPVRKG